MNDAEPRAAGVAAAAAVPLDAEGVREKLRACGLRYSRPREVMLRYLSERDRHVSAESLYVALKGQGEELSLSTVYLNLAVLAGAGLLRSFSGAEGESLYDTNVSHHYHLICRESGEVRDVPAPTVDGVSLGTFLKAYVERLTGWEIEEPRVTLRGVAPKRPSARGEIDRAGAPAADDGSDPPHV